MASTDGATAALLRASMRNYSWSRRGPFRSRNYENAAYPEDIGLLDTATLQRTRSAGPVPPARRPRGYPELDL